MAETAEDVQKKSGQAVAVNTNTTKHEKLLSDLVLDYTCSRSYW